MKTFLRYCILFFLPFVLFNDLLSETTISTENLKGTSVEGQVLRGRSLMTRHFLTGANREDESFPKKIHLCYLRFLL